MNFIQESAKAVIAFLMTILVVYLARKGVTVSTDAQTALVTTLSGLVVAGAVWVTKNRSKASKKKTK